MVEPSTQTDRRTGPLFASGKCPPGVDGTCELPFGFVWTPLQEQPSVPLSSKPMEVCLTCLAYRNPYCSTRGNQWICCICGYSNYTTENSEVDPSPLVDFRQPLSQVLPDETTILLVLDANLPKLEVQAIGKMVEKLVKDDTKKRSWKIGLVVFDEAVSVYQLGISSGMASCHVFQSHQQILDDDSYLLTTSGSIQPLLTCLSACYGLNEAETAPTPKTRLEMLKERKQARLRQQQELEDDLVVVESPTTTSSWSTTTSNATGARCTGPAVQCSLDLVVSGARIWVFTNGCPNTGDGNLGYGASVQTDRISTASKYFRLLGQTALEDGICVDVFCCGSAELGIPVFQSLVEPNGGYALSHDSFGDPQLLANAKFLVSKTRCSIGCFPDIDEEDDVLHPGDDRISMEQPPVSPQLAGTWIEGCSVDVRMSSFLSATHLIGPGDLLECPDGPMISEQEAFEKALYIAKDMNKRRKVRFPSEEMLEASLTRIRLGRLDPLSTFAIMVRVNDFFQRDKLAYFQCVARFVEGDQYVTRVSTHRLPVASNVGEFLEAIDEEVVPVLLGKEAVYRSMFGREGGESETEHTVAATSDLDELAYNAQRDLDHTIFRISGAFRLLALEHGTRSIDLTKEGEIKAAGTSMDFAFPPELSDALRRLFHLRRGPFLSPGPLQSLDDRCEMRSYFLRFPVEECLSMMAPELWSSGPLQSAASNRRPAYESVPPETLALWENRIIAADHWHSIFVWSGAKSTDTKYDKLRETMKSFLLDKSNRRFPQPNLHILAQNDSMSRRFTALLAPLHGDPVEQQLVHFPLLAELSAEEQANLRQRFQFYDDGSDPSFRKWFWDVASAAGARQNKGVSLCE